MLRVGIICEYNPFHNGHLYHIEKIKELHPDSEIVLVMSGYFTERGEISLISKYNKTRIALEYGIDLVLELPVLYGVNSADIFAETAVKILDEANVDELIFGSETCDVELLKKLANAQLDDEDFGSKVKQTMKSGVNYPTALSKVLGTTLKSNDILAVAYIKAIMKSKSKIIPRPIKRTNDFNDITSSNEMISAQNIREKLKNRLDISNYIPKYDKKYINDIDEEKLFNLIKYRILTDNNLGLYLGVDEGIDNVLKRKILKVTSYEDLINSVKSKRYTTSRIRRMLIHILLGIEKEDISITLNNFRILGFTERGQRILKDLDNSNFIYRDNSRIRELELRSAQVYYELTRDDSIKFEYENKPIKF